MAEARWVVNLKTLVGKTYQIECSPDESLDQIYQWITQHLQIPFTDCVLITAGRNLPRHSSLYPKDAYEDVWRNRTVRKPALSRPNEACMVNGGTFFLLLKIPKQKDQTDL